MSRIGWSLLQRLHDRHLDLIVADPAWAAGPGFVQKPLQAPANEAASPLANRLLCDLELLCDLHVGLALSTTEHDPGTKSKGLSLLPTMSEAHQRFSFRAREHEVRFGTPAMHPGILSRIPDSQH